MQSLSISSTANGARDHRTCPVAHGRMFSDWADRVSVTTGAAVLPRASQVPHQQAHQSVEKMAHGLKTVRLVLKTPDPHSKASLRVLQ